VKPRAVNDSADRRILKEGGRRFRATSSKLGASRMENRFGGPAAAKRLRLPARLHEAMRYSVSRRRQAAYGRPLVFATGGRAGWDSRRMTSRAAACAHRTRACVLARP